MKIKEIFYSIQGEGAHAGTPAVFIRFSGCNLKCWFCDEHHDEGTEMTEEQIVDIAKEYPCRFCVITGGEPTLQLTDSLIRKLHSEGFYIAIETNGTNEVPYSIEWVTCSPKSSNINLTFADEVKVVYPCNFINDIDIYCKHKYVQPCDAKNEEKTKKNIEETINFVKAHPEWKISLQTQKILNVR